MIRYMLKCDQDHQFESWFRSADAFDTLCAQAQVSCPLCGSQKVTKAMMAPTVSTTRATGTEPSEPLATAPVQPTPQAAALAPDQPTPEQIERAMAKLRAEVEQNSDYVGVEFADEARKIHTGDAPARAIYGEANFEEAKALLEDGVPVLPLPFLPKRKMN